jgi:hypothetical protein
MDNAHIHNPGVDMLLSVGDAAKQYGKSLAARENHLTIPAEANDPTSPWRIAFNESQTLGTEIGRMIEAMPEYLRAAGIMMAMEKSAQSFRDNVQN